MLPIELPLALCVNGDFVNTAVILSVTVSSGVEKLLLNTSLSPSKAFYFSLRNKSISEDKEVEWTDSRWEH